MKHVGRLLVVLVLLWQLSGGHLEPSLLLTGLAMTGLLLYSSRMAIGDAKRDPRAPLLQRDRPGPSLQCATATTARVMPQPIVVTHHPTLPSLCGMRPVHQPWGCSAT